MLFVEALNSAVLAGDRDIYIFLEKGLSFKPVNNIFIEIADLNA